MLLVVSPMGPCVHHIAVFSSLTTQLVTGLSHWVVIIATLGHSPVAWFLTLTGYCYWDISIEEAAIFLYLVNWRIFRHLSVIAILKLPVLRSRPYSDRWIALLHLPLLFFINYSLPSAYLPYCHLASSFCIPKLLTQSKYTHKKAETHLHHTW